jgi:hypothetical protein
MPKLRRIREAGNDEQPEVSNVRTATVAINNGRVACPAMFSGGPAIGVDSCQGCNRCYGFERGQGGDWVKCAAVSAPQEEAPRQRRRLTQAAPQRTREWETLTPAAHYQPQHFSAEAYEDGDRGAYDPRVHGQVDHLFEDVDLIREALLDDTCSRVFADKAAREELERSKAEEWDRNAEEWAGRHLERNGTRISGSDLAGNRIRRTADEDVANNSFGVRNFDAVRDGESRLAQMREASEERRGAFHREGQQTREERQAELFDPERMRANSTGRMANESEVARRTAELLAEYGE